jgi:hypothetical protein
VPLPDVLVEMLRKLDPKEGRVFDGTNLRKAWSNASVAVGLGTLTRLRYHGFLIHDLRRSAIKNLMKVGVNEKVAMAISGHKTRSVFDRYHIADDADVINVIRKIEAAPVKSLAFSETSIRQAHKRRQLK